MSMDLLGIGADAINAFQLGAAITSKNIANSGDADYSRELVEYATAGEAGGINVHIRRMSDAFLMMNMQTAQSELSRASTSSDLATSIDSYITGLNASDKDGPYNILNRNMQGFFDSISELSTSDKTPARQSVITHAQLLAHNINEISNYMHQQMDGADLKIKDTADEVNSVAKQIAHVNKQMSEYSADIPAGLLDQRDKLVNQLSKLVHVHTVDKNGQTDIYLANGQQIVSGDDTHDLTVEPNQYGDKLTIKVNGSEVKNPAALSAQLGGLIDTRNNYMVQTEEKIGRMAATLTSLYNEQNKAGFKADGSAGGNIFAEMSFSGLPSDQNKGDGAVHINLNAADISKLKDTSYQLTKMSDGKIQLEDLSSGKKTIYDDFPIQVDGLTLTGSGAMQPGDSFKLSPMLQAAAKMKVIAKPADIAAANSADGEGGENLNALADIANQKVFDDGTETLVQGLSSTYAFIGSGAKAASTEAESAQVSLTQATNDKESVSGVNTQEEYTNLIHFQQAYTAASKIISTDEKLFGSLISAIGG